MANETQVGTYHMLSGPTSYEVSRSNNFELIVTGVESMLKAGAKVTADTATDADYTSATGGDSIRLSVVKAKVPHFKQETIEVKRGNTRIYLAGLPTFDEGSIDVNDFIGLNAKEVLLAWQRLSYDATTEKIGRMRDYKKTCTLIEYTPDYEIVRKWELVGCWITGISEGDFSMEDGSKRVITATIRFDRALPLHDFEVEEA